jgi:hypothetical protein
MRCGVSEGNLQKGPGDSVIISSLTGLLNRIKEVEILNVGVRAGQVKERDCS